MFLFESISILSFFYMQDNNSIQDRCKVEDAGILTKVLRCF